MNKLQTLPYLLIVDDLHSVFLEALEENEIPYDYRPLIKKEEALTIVGKYDGLIIRSKFKVDATFIDSAPQLKIIGRVGAGVDNIDEAYAENRGIKLLSAPEGNCDAVGEHMVGMLLTLLNKLTIANSQVRSGLWLREENRGIELGGKTVGLIGYGNNGQAMARKLAGFGVEVLAYDKYKIGFTDQFATEVELEDLFLRADILSLHIPLTSETRNLVNQRFLRKFQKPIFFLNGSRGEIVDVEAVIDGLERKLILGAGLDVLAIEKFPALNDTTWYQKLISFPNVVLSPHVAGWSVQSYFKLSKVLADKLISFIRSNYSK